MQNERTQLPILKTKIKIEKTMKSSEKTTIAFVVSYNTRSVSTQVNPSEPDVSFSE